MIGELEATAACVAEIVDRVEADLDGLVEAVVVEMFGEVPSYRALDAEIRGDVERVVPGVTKVVLDALRFSRSLTPSEVETLRAVGARRAEQGLDVEALLAGARTAMLVGWRRIVAEAHRLEGWDPTVTLGALARMSIDLFGCMNDVGASMATGFMEHEKARMTREVRARAQLFEDLFDGGFTSETELLASAARQGVDLDRPHALVLVWSDGGDIRREAARRAAQALASRFPGAQILERGATLRPHTLLLVPVLSQRTWHALVAACRDASADNEVRVLHVAPVSRPFAIHKSYQRAARRTALVDRLFSRPRSVGMGDLDAHLILAGEAAPGERAEFVEAKLGRLLRLPDEQRAPLLDTLEAMQDGGTLADIAQAVGVHPNTIRHRLKRVEQLTGLAYDVSTARLELEIALRLARLG